MKMIDRKSKMVSFRLSPEEYRQLRDACSSHGVRSISELARAAMQNLLTTNGIEPPLPQQVQELRERVTSLAVQLERLSRHLEPTVASSAAGD